MKWIFAIFFTIIIIASGACASGGQTIYYPQGGSATGANITYNYYGTMNQTPNMTAGAQGVQGIPGINGTDGAQGIQGINGTAATISVNYTFTGSPGTGAQVTNIGSTDAALFDFTIPQGEVVTQSSHSALSNLTSDDHAQYFNLNGRVGTQTIIGSSNSKNLIINGAEGQTGYVVIQGQKNITYVGGSLLINYNTTNTTPYRYLQVATNNAGIRLSDMDSTSDKEANIFLEYYRGINTNRLGYFGFTSASTDELTYATDYTDAFLTFKTSDAIERMRIQADGNVSIGGTSASAKLDNYGDMRIRSLGAGTVYADSNGLLYTVSDAKYKNNIKTLVDDSAISKIKLINPVTYNLNSDNQIKMGFVAGDIKKIIPEAVTTKKDVKYDSKLIKKGLNEDSDIYETVETDLGTTTDTLDDRAIISYLILAIKEEDNKVANMQKEIDDLKVRVAKLERGKA